MKISALVVVFGFLFLLTSACKKKESKMTFQISKLKHAYIHSERILIDNLITLMSEFESDVYYFKNYPTQFAQDSCRSSWDRSYQKFLILSPYRYSDLNLSLNYKAEYNFLDLFPVNYEFIDYSNANPNGGIIQNTTDYPGFSQNILKSLNLKDGSQNITCGFHVLEFLLWGEDLSAASSGQRTHDDYLSTNTYGDRRKMVLLYTMLNLKSSINNLAFTQNFENQILEKNSYDFVNQLIDGIKTFINDDFILSIRVPLETQNGKFELSDFSDLTMTHLMQKLNSLKFILNPLSEIGNDYTSDYFLGDFMEEVDPEIKSNIDDLLETIKTQLKSITSSFDSAILNTTHQKTLNEVIDNLVKLNSAFQQFKNKFI